MRVYCIRMLIGTTDVQPAASSAPTATERVESVLARFEDHLRTRVALSTCGVYMATLRTLIRRGGSPGWGPEETPEAAERRAQHIQTLALRSRGSYVAAWNQWSAFIAVEHQQTIPVLFAQDAPPTMPPTVAFAVLALYEATSEPEVLRLTWSRVNIATGLIAKSDEDRTAHTKAEKYGPGRIRAALTTLQEHFQPTSNEEYVLPGDTHNRYMPYPPRIFRTLVQEALRLRAQGRRSEVAGTSVVGVGTGAVTGTLTTPQPPVDPEVRAARLRALSEAANAKWGDLTPRAAAPPTGWMGLHPAPAEASPAAPPPTPPDPPSTSLWAPGALATLPVPGTPASTLQALSPPLLPQAVLAQVAARPLGEEPSIEGLQTAAELRKKYNMPKKLPPRREWATREAVSQVTDDESMLRRAPTEAELDVIYANP